MSIEPRYGQTIRDVRKAFGFTQEEFALRSGIALNSLRRYESNERQPTLDIIGKMAAAVGLPLQEFLWYNPRKNRSPLWSFNLDQKLKHIGYSIGFDEDDAYLWINYPDGTLEVTDADLQALNENAEAYFRFLLHDLRERNKKDFRPKKPDADLKEGQ